MSLLLSDTKISKRTRNIILRHFRFMCGFDKNKLDKLTIDDVIALAKKADGVRSLGPAAIEEIASIVDEKNCQ